MTKSLLTPIPISQPQPIDAQTPGPPEQKKIVVIDDMKKIQKGLKILKHKKEQDTKELSIFEQRLSILIIKK